MCVYACYLCVCLCAHVPVCVSVLVQVSLTDLAVRWVICHPLCWAVLAGSVLTGGRKEKHLEVQGSSKGTRGRGCLEAKVLIPLRDLFVCFCPMWVMSVHLEAQERKAPPLANTGADIWAAV